MCNRIENKKTGIRYLLDYEVIKVSDLPDLDYKYMAHTPLGRRYFFTLRGTAFSLLVK